MYDYEHFYGLKRCPFPLTLEPNVLYSSAQHREALAALFYGIATNKGLTVLAGDVGTGKTTVLWAALEKLAAAYGQRFQHALVVNPHLTSDDLLEFVMATIGVGQVPSSKARRLIRFNEFLLSSRQAGKISAIIIDEAHRLTPELLEEIRLWVNFETANAKLLQVVLAGQPELATLLDRPDMRQVKQRISVRVSLNPLASSEVQPYIDHRWKKAGGSTVPFTADALQTITRISKGYPRLINVLCDNALLVGFAAGVHEIGAAQVSEAAADLELDTEKDEPLPFKARLSSRRAGSTSTH